MHLTLIPGYAFFSFNRISQDEDKMPSLELSPRLTLHYLDHNSEAGKGALLLHGLGATSESWQLQFPSISNAGFRIIAPDARGFGHSTYPGGNTSISEMTGDFINLLDHLQTGPVDVVGISMGGTHALQFALDAPQMVHKLVLVNTFARLRPQKASDLFYFASRMLVIYTLGLSTQARIVANRLFPNPDQEELRQELIKQINQADPKGYRAAMRALGIFDVETRLSEIRAPTLVVTGERDTTVPPRLQQNLAQGIANARQVIIPDAGHAVTAEQPQIFNETLLEFLEDTEP